jgi:transcriptional regulator with XRE-family HTH domain
MARDPFTWSEGNNLINALGREDHLAARITLERKNKGWTQSQLARELAKIEGAPPIHQTAISKIENPRNGRRAISVDEAIAFARVFDIPLGELVLPPESVRHASIMRGLADGQDLLRELWGADERYGNLVQSLAAATAGDAYWAGHLADELEAAIAKANARGLDPELSVEVAFLRDVLEARAEHTRPAGKGAR